MAYKTLSADVVLQTHEFFVDTAADLEELPIEPASSALVVNTGDIYICNNAGEWVNFSNTNNNSTDNTDDSSEETFSDTSTTTLGNAVRIQFQENGQSKFTNGYLWEFYTPNFSFGARNLDYFVAPVGSSVKLYVILASNTTIAGLQVKDTQIDLTNDANRGEGYSYMNNNHDTLEQYISFTIPEPNEDSNNYIYINITTSSTPIYS